MYVREADINVARINTESVTLQNAESATVKSQRGEFSIVNSFVSNLTINPTTTVQTANMQFGTINTISCTNLTGNQSNIINCVCDAKITANATINTETVSIMVIEDTRSNTVSRNSYTVDMTTQTLAEVQNCTVNNAFIEILSNDVLTVKNSFTQTADIETATSRTAKVENMFVDGNLATYGPTDYINSKVEVSKSMRIVHDGNQPALRIKQENSSPLVVIRDDETPVFVTYPGGQTHICRYGDLSNQGGPLSNHTLRVFGNCKIDQVDVHDRLDTSTMTTPEVVFAGPATISGDLNVSSLATFSVLEIT